MPLNLDCGCGRFRLRQALTVRMFESGDEIRPADLADDLRQLSSNAVKSAARRLPCPNALGS
ncbi:hypothetical protein P0D73_42890 [Paraburkholderia sp. RL18-101-BIB-B]|uniref:hypothetical protein n=1 Tax=Paraburkholderia sp. RL18-101-BIB-B TaxID=3031634 RepID=UPI0038BB7125